MSEEHHDSKQEIPVATILDKLRRGKRIKDEYRTEFRKNYKISGLLMSEWEKKFKPNISPDIQPVQGRQMGVTLVELHNEATFYKAAAEAELEALKAGTEIDYRATIAAIVADCRLKGNKVPAAATLEALAKEKDETGAYEAIPHLQIEITFWKDILSSLEYRRKQLENITINWSVERKLNEQH